MTNTSNRILISTGEASGDLHASLLMNVLLERHPDTQFYGLGGPQCRKAGLHDVVTPKNISVVGILEAFKRLSAVFHTLRQMRQFIQNVKPDLIILVDFSGLNLRLAKTAHQAGIPVVYYVSPQIWAWRRQRIKTIKRYIDHMIVFFSFEENLYQAAGIPVSCVGHPLADHVYAKYTPQQVKNLRGLKAKTLIGLMPGSRTSEIERLLPKMLGAILRLKAELGHVDCIMIESDGVDPNLIERHLLEHAQGLTIHRQRAGQEAYDALASCDCVITASGTATLELALLKVPMVIVYQLDTLSYAIANRLIKLKDYGLCNIAAGQRIVPELIQSDCTVNNIVHSVNSCLTPSEQTRIRKAFATLQSQLKQGAVNRAAEEISNRFLK